MRDRQLCKTSISSERTLQTVTIAIMLVDCTKLVYPICQLSSSVIWLKTEMTHYASTEKNSQHTFISRHASNGTVGKSVSVCHSSSLLSLQIVQNFYTSQSLGVRRPPSPPKWRHCPSSRTLSLLAVQLSQNKPILIIFGIHNHKYDAGCYTLIHHTCKMSSQHLVKCRTFSLDRSNMISRQRWTTLLNI